MESSNGLGRKRKAHEVFGDEEVSQTVNNEVDNGKESYMATEEEIKKRRILKVVRRSTTPTENEVPKGRFTFFGGDKIEGQTSNKELMNTIEINNNLQTNTSISASTPSKSDLNQSSKSKITTTIISLKGSKMMKKEGGVAEPVSNSIFISEKPEVIDVAKHEEEKKSITINQSQSIINPHQETTQINMLEEKKTIFSNPFANYKTNQLTTDTGTNRFSFNTNAKFNFNMNECKPNQNWMDSDEEDEGLENPEEEVKIEGKASTSKVLVKTDKNIIKFIKLHLDDLAVFNFIENKFESKGAGDISIEFTKTEKNQIVPVCVYRNNILNILFQATIVKNISSYKTNSKNFKHYGFIQRLLGNDKSPKAVKLTFSTEQDSMNFNQKIEEAFKILDKNDISIFPE